MHPKDRQTGLIAAFPEVGGVSTQHASGALHSGLSALPMAPIFIRSGSTPAWANINMCESHIHIIMPFDMEGRDNCAAVRLGGEQSCAGTAGRNEGELHLMSLERKLNPQVEPLTVGRRPQGYHCSKPVLKPRGFNGSRDIIRWAGSAQAACREVMFEKTGRSPSSGLLSSMRYKRQSLKSVCEFGEVGVARSRVERSVMDWDRRGGIWLAAHERGKGR